MPNFGIRPIAAFSMSDYESLTRGDSANFARGKDKKKRKSRGAGFYAGAGAAGLAGAGAIGAGVRYGVPAVKYRNAQKNFDAKGLLATKGGAKGQFDRDVNSVKEMGSRIKNYDYKGAPGRALESVKSAPGRIGASAKRAGEAFKSGEGVLGKLKGMYGSGTVGKAGLIGAGLLGAGAVGAAGVAGYRALNKKKKK